MLSMLISKSAIYVAMFTAATLAVLSVLFGARQAGRNAQRVADAKGAIRAIDTATRIAANANAMSDDAIRQQLRKQRAQF